MTLETLITFLTIENNNMNNYIVTFEYRVMVTAFAILAMFCNVLSVSMFTIVNCFHGTPIELCGVPQHGGTFGALSIQTPPTK